MRLRAEAAAAATRGAYCPLARLNFSSRWVERRLFRTFDTLDDKDGGDDDDEAEHQLLLNSDRWDGERAPISAHPP